MSKTRRGKDQRLDFQDIQIEQQQESTIHVGGATVVENLCIHDVYQLTKSEAPDFLDEAWKFLQAQPELQDQIDGLKFVAKSACIHICQFCGGVGHGYDLCMVKPKTIKLANGVAKGFDKVIADGMRDAHNVDENLKRLVVSREPSKFTTLKGLPANQPRFAKQFKILELQHNRILAAMQEKQAEENMG